MNAASPQLAGAGKPVLARKTRTFERPGIWFILGLLGLFVLGALALLSYAFASSLGRPGEADQRGYTLSGMILGFVAAVLAGVVLLYSLRKRGMQEGLRKSGSMMSWLWLHVTLGIMVLCASLMHAGCGAVSLNFSTGKVLFLSMLVVSVSGVIWRIRYATVPAAAAKRIGNYSQAQSVKRAEEQLTEIEKIAAGKSQAFHQLKGWLLAAPRAPAELQGIPAMLPPDELQAAEELVRLCASRHRALERGRLQQHYIKRLQGLRIMHIPLALAFPVLLIVHVVGALRVPERVFPAGYAPTDGLTGYAPSEDCAQCHRQIYEEWRHSMHAHAARSPAMIAQTNQLVRAELGALPSPDPRQVCVNCHGPLGAALTNQATLPYERSLYSDDLLNEGIGCNVCHQYTGRSGVGIGGLSSFAASIEPGNVYYGSYRDPVPNAYHRSETTPLYAKSDDLCKSCHNVQLDIDGDGVIVKGPDLVLQTTSQEHDEYRREGGTGTCLTCHMPVRAKGSDAADSALPLLEQDGAAPPRVTHEHTFIGVDYSLDEPPDRDPFEPRRSALLRSAARLELSPLAVRGVTVSFTVSITNVGTGHNLPTGFAFARQMWLEVTGADESGRLLFSSGLLSDPTQDLCDAGTLDDPDNPLKRHMIGCTASDPQLVNIQAKLIDRRDILRNASGVPVRDDNGEQVIIAAPGARESVLQHLKGGVTARVRPSTKQKMTSIPPNDTVSFAYRFTMARVSSNPTVTVRLLFRNLPPYFVRGLAAGQPGGERPQIAPLVKNLRIAEMAKQVRSAR